MAISRFGFFDQLPLRTFEEALPRTIAPMTAAAGFIGGLGAGGFVSMFLFAFTTGNGNTPKATFNKALAIAGAFTFACGVGGGMMGYISGYGQTNLSMASFPPLKEVESRFLLGPGFQPQCYLFLGTVAVIVLAPFAAMAVKEVSNRLRP